MEDVVTFRRRFGDPVGWGLFWAFLPARVHFRFFACFTMYIVARREDARVAYGASTGVPTTHRHLTDTSAHQASTGIDCTRTNTRGGRTRDSRPDNRQTDKQTVASEHIHHSPSITPSHTEYHSITHSQASSSHTSHSVSSALHCLPLRAGHEMAPSRLRRAHRKHRCLG